MARTLKITDGTTSVNLIDTAATGIILQRGGGGPGEIPLGFSEGPQVVERWTFNLKGSSHDNVASQLSTLIKLTRQAKQYHEEIWRRKAVYVESQTTAETAARYALLFEATDLEIPDRYDFPFEGDSELEGLGLTLVRAPPWSSQPPGTLGAAVELDASNGPADPSKVHLANFRDTANLTHVFVDDGGVFGSNLLSAGSGTALWPASPADEDHLYFGSTDGPFKHVCLGIATAMASFTGNLVVEYWDGADWGTVTVLGTEYTLFAAGLGEVTDIDQLFTAAGLWSINLFPKSDWAAVAINSVTAHWIRIRIEAFTSMGTVPTKDGSAIYAQRSPHLEIPAAALGGDSPATLCLRLWAPSGGGVTPGPASLSRILVGAKSRGLTTFVSHLNAGGADNPAAWLVAYGTDSASASDPASPGGARAHVTFATDTNMVARVKFTGDGILDDYEGEYRAFVRLEQVGGDAGDCEIRLRTYLGAESDKYPNIDTPDVATEGADQGPEWLDLGLLRLPLTRAFNADDLSDTDLIFQVMAARLAGSAVLRIHDLCLLPVDEWTCGLDDFAADTTNGNTSLKGGNVLDVDGGLIGMRIQRYLYDGTTLAPADIWGLMGWPPELRSPSSATRLYFLLLHFSDAWGQAPLASRLGCHLAAELFIHQRYAVLRGSG